MSTSFLLLIILVAAMAQYFSLYSIKQTKMHIASFLRIVEFYYHSMKLIFKRLFKVIGRVRVFQNS